MPLPHAELDTLTTIVLMAVVLSLVVCMTRCGSCVHDWWHGGSVHGGSRFLRCQGIDLTQKDSSALSVTS